jgi:cyanophycinase
MNGLINLVGSGEYLPVMRDVDRYLLECLNLKGRKPRVACLPTAAGQEGNASVSRWLRMGVKHFEELGAQVTPIRIVNRATADDPQWEPLLEEADLIYFSGGDPGYLYDTLHESCAWRAAQRAWERGAIYAGCSAGAMILGRRIPALRFSSPRDGFGLIPATYVIPHFDAIPAVWKPLLFALQRQLKQGERMIGIDEDTALIGRLGQEWTVKGKAGVHICEGRKELSYASGQTLLLA